jgi:hypothetical protein
LRTGTPSAAPERPVELALTWDPETAGWTLAGDAEQYKVSMARAEVMEVLARCGEPMTSTEVADALGKSVNAVKKLMWQMSRGGQLSASDGRYSLSNNGNPDNPRNRNPE